jgi:hypothetical protein
MGLAEVSAGIAAALSHAGRDAASVTLIAVSKEQPPERVEPILSAGQRVFGENRVQEAEGRWTPLLDRWGPLDLHLIGPLQTNKARAAMRLFQAIHTLDRLKLAETLARLAQETGACPRLFVQVNTGAEPQKAGCAPAEADSLIAAARGLDLPVTGCMCIPPDGQDPVPHFRLLRSIAQANGLAGLSMGMSGDYALAIAEGATHVRVGSAIFGTRAPRPVTPP